VVQPWVLQQVSALVRLVLAQQVRVRRVLVLEHWLTLALQCRALLVRL
jgi:hypothetical protein